jgi:hypothetical protein
MIYISAQHQALLKLSSVTVQFPCTLINFLAPTALRSNTSFLSGTSKCRHPVVLNVINIRITCAWKCLAYRPTHRLARCTDS